MSNDTAPVIVVAGLGSIGQRHLRNLLKLRPEARLVALRRPGSAPLSKDCPDALEVHSIDEAIALKPKAAILSGPAPSHVPLAQRFLEAGCGVLIEKPLSHDMAGLSELGQVASSTGLPVMVAYNLRFNPVLRDVRAALEREVIGSVLAVRAEVGQYLPDWRPQSDYRESVSAQSALGGGPLLELSHELDYLLWMFGMPDRVTSIGGRYSELSIDVDDCVAILMEYGSPRRLVSVHLDFLQRPASRQCKFIGSRGTLTLDLIHDSYEIATPAAGKPNVETVKFPQQDRNQTYLDELDNFLDAVEGRGEVKIPLGDGVQAMRVISAARSSAATGCAVDLQGFE